MLFIILLSACFEMLGVSLMVPLITTIINTNIISENTIIGRFCSAFGIVDHIHFVIVCIGMLIVVYIVKNGVMILSDYVQAKFTFYNKFHTQKKILHAYLSKPYEFYLTTSSSDVLNVIVNDVDSVYSLILTTLKFISECVISLVLVITIFVIDPIMTSIIFMLLVVLILFISQSIKPKLKTLGKDSRMFSKQTYRTILQAINGIKEIKITKKETFFEEKYNESGTNRARASMRESVYNTIPRNLIEVGCVCSTLLVIAIMIQRGKSLDSLIPALGAFAMAAIKLMPSANNIVRLSNSIAYNGPAIDSVIENLKLAREQKETVYDEDKGNFSLGKIEMKDISYRYPFGNTNVLENINIEIPVGSSVGIIGKSGAGKTTTVDILLGLLKPSKGKVTSDGNEISTDYVNWLSHIGYIPQSLYILNGSIKENVAFGCEPDDDKVWEALYEAQLGSFVKELPQGIETQIGESGICLSGGQKQRIAIARALYKNPEILVFDEATSSLDNETEKAIIDSINSFHGKKTMIIISHRLQTIGSCDIVYNIENKTAHKVKE